MLRQICQRLLLAIPLLLGVLIVGFVLMQVVPTDPAVVRAGPTATPDVIAAIRTELGLDKPLWYQFLVYLNHLLHGDLGVSIINNVPVTQELGNTIGPTLELLFSCLVWAIPVGMVAGTAAAYWRGSIFDRALMAVAVASATLPVFFVGLSLIWLLGYAFPLLPFTGRGGPLYTWAGIQAIILPALALGCTFVGPMARMTRTAVLDVLGAEHVRTARAKGVGEFAVVLHHALRNAMIPVVTLIGLQVGFLLGGAVITETVFSWPGVGRLAVGAILSADFPMAQGTILVLSLGFIIVNLIVDVLYVALDPRMREA